MNQHSSNKTKYYSPLIGAALVAASLFQFSLPVFAAGTGAGELLRNTATGTYKDDADNTYEIESNTVDITVGKVAGITNQPTGFTDNTGDADNTTVLTNDIVTFEFTVTNVGNDVTNIVIPDKTQIATKGLDRDTLIVQVSNAVAPNGAAPTFNPIPTDGTDPTDAATGSITRENVAINGTVVVQVSGQVSATAAGAPIEVLLGNTGSNLDPNDPVADTQNQPDNAAVADGGDDADAAEQPKDVRTETASSDTGNPPLNGQREASALQQVLLGSNPLAMTRIEKVRGDVQDGVDANALDDNIIPYSLELEVLSSTPNSFFTPGDLEGRNYAPAVAPDPANPNTATFPDFTDVTNLILVSDAIPANTDLATPLTAVAGSGWIPVYSIQNGLPDEIQWTTTPPGTLSDVTRVGWVYDVNDTNNDPIPTGTIVSTAEGGFSFNVITNGIDATTGGTVANIAQVFGSTVNGADIFDESGDQDPSNFNGANQGPNEDDPQSTGIADPANHDVDSNNDNTATGSIGGEDNVITIGAPGQILNGPQGQPSATGDIFDVGPDNNHDFQNLGVANFPTDAVHNKVDAAGAPDPTLFDPDVVTFTNTLSNPGTTDLDNVLLQPINPEFNAAFANNADPNGVEDTDLPVGTLVTLELGAQTATYEYIVDPNDATLRRFELDSGTPITIPQLLANTPLDYTVQVDLPDNTGLSTDDSINGGFPIPIIAFQDETDPLVAGANDGSPQVTENNNLTVNQVYTGHIKVSKQVRVLDPADLTQAKGGMDFADDDLDKDPIPGDILEYRIIYRNISEPQSGTGNNVVLNGVDVVIEEDGTLDFADDGTLNDSNNNWALDNNDDDDMDTVNVQGSATDSNGGTIDFYTGVAVGTSDPLTGLTPSGTVDPGETVTGYSSTVDTLAPTGAEDIETDTSLIKDANAGDSTFIFQRKVDEFDGLAAEGLETQ